jgi:DNA-binding transcriptional LysR family regulator
VKPLLDEGRIVPVLENWVGRSPELHALFPRGRIQFLKTRLFVDFLTEQFSRLSI